MRRSDKVLILAPLSAGMLLWGCAKTLREQKSMSSDSGNITQLKFTGSKVKLEHNF